MKFNLVKYHTTEERFDLFFFWKIKIKTHLLEQPRKKELPFIKIQQSIVLLKATFGAFSSTITFYEENHLKPQTCLLISELQTFLIQNKRSKNPQKKKKTQQKWRDSLLPSPIKKYQFSTTRC